MATLPVIQNKGLQPADNQLVVPLGSMVEALNCIIRFRDVLEPRRGQRLIGQTPTSASFRAFGASSSRSNEGAFFESSLLVHYGSGTLTKDIGTTFLDYAGTLEPPDAARLRMKFLVAARSLWLPTKSGVAVLETSDVAAADSAGVPKPISLRVEDAIRSASGVHPNKANCAYRAVWGRRDAHGRLQLSAVSQRVEVRNDSLKVAIGGMSRASSTVTVNYTGGPIPVVGDTVTMQAVGTADANFPAGAKTVATSNSTQFTYTESGTATTSTTAYEALLGAKSNHVEVGRPSGLNASSFCMLYRTLFTTAEGVSADDEFFQVGEVPIPPAKTAAAGGLSSAGTKVTVTIAGHGYLLGQRINMTPGEANFPAGEYFVEALIDANTFRIVGTAEITATSTAAQTFTPVRNLVICDRQPESLLGGPLYTNPNTGDGIEASNERPPIAKDLCEWQGRVWYLNTTDKHRFSLQMLGVGSPDGVQSGDTIVIGGRTYTAGGSTAAPGPFPIITTRTPAQNVEATARYLCDAINRDDSSPVYAYYSSAVNETPGKILLEERGIGGASFALHASRPASWFPVLPTSNNGSAVSRNDRRKNGLSYSRRGQPEAVPLTNFLSVGPDVEGLRVIPLRDKLFVFPEHGGIYTVSGEFPFRVDLLDGTTWLLAPDSAVVHANQIFALTNQGVCAISDAGVRVVSKGIEDALLELMTSAPAAVKRYAFGVSSETDRQFQLWLPSSPSETSCTQAFVYNSLLGVWTRWTGNRTWGRVNPSEDVLYLGDGSANTVRVERKTGSQADFAEESLARNISAVSSTSITLDSTAGLAAGDMLWQSSSVRALITTINSGTVVTVAFAAPFSTGSVLVHRAIECRAKFAPFAPAGPSIRKLFRDCTFHFRRLAARLATALFDTEISSSEASVALTTRGGYGTTTFTGSANPRNERVGISREHADATQLRVGLRVREAWAQWALNGVSVEYEVGSERNSR